MTIIPTVYSEECVAKSEDVEAICEIISMKLPEVHYKVVVELIRLLRLLGKPESVTKTKMGFQNLALVFAPAFLQPHQSPNSNVMIFNSERERDFIANALEFAKI